MRRAANGRLSGRRSIFPPDPDWVDAEFEKLKVGVSFDASLLFTQDPEQVLKNRLFMKAVLARYGRIDPHSWGGREVVEMVAYFEEVVEMVRREGAPTEDR